MTRNHSTIDRARNGVKTYLSAIDGRLLPVYIMLSVAFTLIGILTIIVFAEAGVPASEIDRLRPWFAIMALLPMVLALGLGPAELALRRWWGRES